MLINELYIRIIRILFCWKIWKRKFCTVTMGADSKIPHAWKKNYNNSWKLQKNNPMEIKFNRNSSVNKNRFLFMTEIICALPNSLHLFFELHVDGVDFVSCFVWFPLFIWNFRGFCLLWNNCVYGEYITMRGTEFVNQCGLYRYFCSYQKDWLLFENNMNGQIPQYCRNFILLNQIFRYDFSTNFWCNQCGGINKYSLLIALSTTRKFVHSNLAAI